MYVQTVKSNLSKLLNLYNLDTFSRAYGYGDREYWAWKTKDFVNGTMQGGVHALAISVKLKIIDNEKFILNVIDSAIRAIEKIRHKNGSMIEAYPNEHSFCVTALVAFDVLSAVKHLGEKLDRYTRKTYLSIVKPLIHFISIYNETHALISNHLATGAAAITLWNNLMQDNNPRDQQLLEVIYQHQSDEGWYREYEGADPGYQTLCVYYLFCIYEITKDKKLLESLNKSAGFLKYFIHPDGTIGGLYGSRNTEVYYPGGIVGFAKENNDSALLAKFLEPKKTPQHIMPSSVDIGNFIPLINSYAVAALYQSDLLLETKPIYQECFEKSFPDAGLFIKSTDQYYLIINYKKGGVIKVFDKITGMLDIEDGGIFGSLKNGKRFSTQQYDNTVNFDQKDIRSRFYLTNEDYLSPFKFIILRFLSLTIFRSIKLGEWFKYCIVKYLMTGKKEINGYVKRSFYLTDNKIVVSELWDKPPGCVGIDHYGQVKSIHMASSGYWLAQAKDAPIKSRLVEFYSEEIK
ncbi:MAG: hypothetical protein A2X77_04775 [Gammaproteobacteria bacterium GWE2_42_36]|nr:MAG: hypothetical protein A2X77_04775 [Gammaproteobacteria bacterium GWE2_42_36]